MNGIFANYLWTMFWGSVFWIMWFFPRKYKYRCIRAYVWFKDDKHFIWMWIWLIQKNINLLDRIWSLWLVRFAHSPPNFIFWLGRLIFSVSINSHPDNIYLSVDYWQWIISRYLEYKRVVNRMMFNLFSSFQYPKIQHSRIKIQYPDKPMRRKVTKWYSFSKTIW